MFARSFRHFILFDIGYIIKVYNIGSGQGAQKCGVMFRKFLCMKM